MAQRSEISSKLLLVLVFWLNRKRKNRQPLSPIILNKYPTLGKAHLYDDKVDVLHMIVGTWTHAVLWKYGMTRNLWKKLS